MAWNSRSGYRDRYLGGAKSLRNRALAWVFARRGEVPSNIPTKDQREGSSFFNPTIVLDYDFDDMDGSFLFNKAPGGDDYTLVVQGGEWIDDQEYCMSGFTTSGTYGAIRGRSDVITETARNTKQFTIDTWIRAHDLTTTGPPRIFSMAPSTSGTTGHGSTTPDSFYRRNLSLLQGPNSSPYAGDDLQARFRVLLGASESELNGTTPPPEIAEAVLTQDQLHHVALVVQTVDGEGVPEVTIGIYVDGDLVSEQFISVDGGTYDDVFTNWGSTEDGSYLLSLFDEASEVGIPGQRAWKGTMYRWRFWAGALNSILVKQLFDAGPKGSTNCNWGGGGAIGDLDPVSGNIFTPPVANDDYATVYYGDSKPISVLENDVVYGEKYFRRNSLRVVTQPTSGTAEPDIYGRIEYSAIDYPDTTPGNQDSFTYKVKDNANLWTTGTVYVNIASGPPTGVFTPTIPFPGGTAYPGRLAPYGANPGDVTFSGGPASGSLVDACGVDWVIPWKSTTGPNNDYYKIEELGDQYADDVQLSGFAMLYPDLDSEDSGGITITQPGTYENFVSYKKIRIRAHDVTLKNFVVDACLAGDDNAKAAIWQKQNSVGYDPDFWASNVTDPENIKGPCPLYQVTNNQGIKEYYERQNNSVLYAIDCNKLPGTQTDVSGTVIEDGIVTWGSSKTILLRDDSIVKRCEIKEGGADAIEFVGDNVSAVGNWVHHFGALAKSHSDGMQSTGNFNTYMIGNFFDMPSPATVQGAPYKSNAAYIMSPTKVNYANIAMIGNWINAGSYTLIISVGQKWTRQSTLGVTASATGTCTFSLKGNQFSATPEEGRSNLAGDSITLEKYVVKGSTEAYWWEVPEELYGRTDASTIVLSGPAGGWEPITYDPTDPFAGPDGYKSTYGDPNAGCLCPNPNTYFDQGDYNAYFNDPAGWDPTVAADCDWIQEGQPCTILFKPTVDGDPMVFSSTNSQGVPYGQGGVYRIADQSKCMIIGRYDDGNETDNRYHPKTASGILVADNRWGDHFQYGPLKIGDAHQCCGDFEFDNPSNEAGTLSSLLFSGNVWDYTGQLIGSQTGGYTPDYNAIHDDLNAVRNFNDWCIPASGTAYGQPSTTRLRSQGYCTEFANGLEFSEPPFPIAPPHCPDPWCP